MPNSLKSLLPCPHCGKSDFDEWPIMEASGDDRRYIRCVWCLASAPEATWSTRTPIAEVGASLEGVYARYLPKGTLMLADPGGELRYNCYEIKHNGKTHILPLIDESKAIESLSRQGGEDKPAECAQGCPPMQVCDYCQGGDGIDVARASEAWDWAGELLAALIAAEERLREYEVKIDWEWGNCTADMDDPTEVWGDEIRSARAAISKAKGAIAAAPALGGGR